MAAITIENDAATPHIAPPIRFTDSKASLLLDIVRGFAALCVLLEHWRNIFFVDWNQLASHRPAWAPFYLLVSAGHQAVMIFFVLSGYLISASVFRMFAGHRWSWRMYFTHRLLRLWIVLLPALLLTAALDHVGMRIHRPSAVTLYAGLSGDHVIGPPPIATGWHALLGNAFFLQTVATPTYGTDTALWSLANEFWYYVLFPLGLVACRRRTPPLPRAICAASFLAVALLLPFKLTAAFPIWLLGTLLAILPPPRLAGGARWLATAIYVPLFFAFARAPFLRTAWWADYLLGLATFLFLWVLLSARSQAAKPASATRGFRTLARFSFTLYAVHTPMLALCAALLLGPQRWQPKLAPMAAAAAVLLLVTALAWAIALVTEFRTDAVRAHIERWLGGSGARLPQTLPSQPR